MIDPDVTDMARVQRRIATGVSQDNCIDVPALFSIIRARTVFLVHLLFLFFLLLLSFTLLFK